MDSSYFMPPSPARGEGGVGGLQHFGLLSGKKKKGREKGEKGKEYNYNSNIQYLNSKTKLKYNKNRKKQKQKKKKKKFFQESNPAHPFFRIGG